MAAIALCFDPHQLDISCAVLELLSVISWFDADEQQRQRQAQASSSGYDRVMRAMDAYGRAAREPCRFHDVVRVFRLANGGDAVGGASFAQRLSIVTFVNTVINNAPTLEARVSTRNDFLALGILQECGTTLDMIDDAEASAPAHSDERCTAARYRYRYWYRYGG